MKMVYIQTPLGITEIKGDEQGIYSISIIDYEVQISTKIPIELRQCASQLQEYFISERSCFDFNLKPQGTEFQLRVWQELMKIPYGKTISYLELSKRLGDVKAIRAVASANGKNPLWIVIPCHRVLGTNGSLTGYAGGLWRKKWLLEHESPTGQQTLF
jgi:methylated-DNA-[protein]-cysteine S-methyltransferase